MCLFQKRFQILRRHGVHIHEVSETYDPWDYEMELIQAAATIRSPMGWDRSETRRELTGERIPDVTACADAETP